MKSAQSPSKDELERQKLALEIGELERRWWQRPAYLSASLPIVLASLTVLAGILSGFFNQERAKLRSEIAALGDEKTALIAQIEAAKTALLAQNERSNRELAKMQGQVTASWFERRKAQTTPAPSPSATPSPN